MSLSGNFKTADKSIEYKEAQIAKDFYSEAVNIILDGNIQKLKQLLETFISDHSQYDFRIVIENFHSEGKTLLHIAAVSGKFPIVEYFLDKIGDASPVINLKDNLGFSLLMNATISESSDMMMFLIKNGADVNLRNNTGASAAHFAASDGSVERLNILREASADFNFNSQAGTPLHWAVGKHRLEAVRFLIRNGANINIANSDGMTPVCLAAATSSEAIVLEFLSAKASINILMKDSVSLLHLCSENGLTNCVKLILDSEEGNALAKTETSDGLRNLPIHYAAMSNQIEIIQLLIPYSGDEFSGLSVESILEIGVKRMQLWQENQSAKIQQDLKKSSPQVVPISISVEPPEPTNPAESPEAATRAEEYKNEGNRLYQSRLYAEALATYSLAIREQGDNHVLWSNRSACYLTSGDAHRALRDAEVCRKLKPDWPKGAYRLAAARLALGMYEDAALAAFEGCKLDDSNEDLKNVLRKAVKLGQEDHKKNSTVGSR